MSGIVDKHIIVEALKTFTGRSKPLHYNTSKHMFSEYAGRIFHVVIEKMLIEDVQDQKSVSPGVILTRNGHNLTRILTQR